jgi:hypothetical protein
MRELSPEEKESTGSTPATSMYEQNPNNRKTQESTPDSGTDEERETTTEPEIEYASGFKLVAVILALALSVFLVSLDLTIVATAIPKITDVCFLHSPKPLKQLFY